MPEPKTVLVVEDDPLVRDLVREALSQDGHRLLEADGVSVGMNLFKTRKPDLILLDLRLPDGDGLEFCRKVRESGAPATPVIMLTAQTQLEEKILGFKAGADQYLCKPVLPQELRMWVEALLRRVEFDRDEGDVVKAGDLAIELRTHLVRFRGQTIPYLTGKEFDLLAYLVKKRPKVVSRKEILGKLWHQVSVDHVVDTHLSNLRRKLPPEVSDKLQNVPGAGFRYFEERA